MYSFFIKYRYVVSNGVVFIALVVALLLNNGALREFFIGLGTGVAFINFGESISSVKKQKA